MRDDAALLREFAAQRSESAFAELVRRHIDAVYSAALRRVGGDTHLAEDVTQHVFTALATKAASLAHHPFLTAWLYTATRHEAANTVRTERRRRAREQEALEMHESSAATSAEPDWRRIALVLDQAIDQLGESDRTALLLRFFERQPFADIGVRLQLSEDAARMRVDRALDKLRRALARRGVTSTATALGVALTQDAVAAAPAALAASVSNAAVLGSATTSATLLTTLSVMIQSKIATFLATTAVLGTFGLGIFEIRESQAAAAALAEARTEEAVALARLAAKEREAAATAATLADRENKIQSATKAPAGDDSAEAIKLGTTTAQSWNPRAEGLALMERHPEVRAALHAWCDAKTNFDWSGFYVTAGLSAAEIADFQKLWRERGKLGRSLKHAGDGREIEFYAGTGLSNAEIEDRTRELLGPDRYRQYQTYLRERPAGEFAGQLASALAFSAEPLLAEQFDRLKRDLVSRNAFAIGRAGPEYRWDEIMAAARGTLSPVQVAAVEAVRTQAELNAAWSRAGMALTAKGKE